MELVLVIVALAVATAAILRARAERARAGRLRAAWEAERAWSRDLLGRIKQQEHRDVRELILEAAIELVGAEKGLMLSRHDQDGDGDLDFVLARGFEHDPTHSEVAQRFGREGLERDRIVRENDPPADAEIESLVAIPVYVHDRFDGVIVCANRPGGFAEVGDDTLLALGDHAGAALHHGRLRHDLRDAHRATIRVLAEACAARDPVLHRESGELALRASWLARDLGFDTRERDVLVCATMLRAVGNLALPERLPLKPAPLTPEERSLVQLHPRLGFDIIAQAPPLRDVAATVLYHHERFDGAGYPARLGGEDIPRTARALAVLEAFGAMVHERPYRTPWPVSEACDEILEHAGAQFDPEVARVFVNQARRMPVLPGGELEDVALEALPVDPAAHEGALLERLGAAAIDGLTLLANHRTMLEAARRSAAEQRPFAVVLVQLEELPRINDERGHLEGDRLIGQAARRAQRAASRTGGAAYRASGRRLAVLAPLGDGDGDAVLEQVQAEFLGGPAVTCAVATWRPGERGDEPVTRARHALRATSAR